MKTMLFVIMLLTALFSPINSSEPCFQDIAVTSSAYGYNVYIATCPNPCMDIWADTYNVSVTSYVFLLQRWVKSNDYSWNYATGGGVRVSTITDCSVGFWKFYVKTSWFDTNGIYHWKANTFLHTLPK